MQGCDRKEEVKKVKKYLIFNEALTRSHINPGGGTQRNVERKPSEKKLRANQAEQGSIRGERLKDSRSGTQIASPCMQSQIPLMTPKAISTKKPPNVRAESLCLAPPCKKENSKFRNEVNDIPKVGLLSGLSDDGSKTPSVRHAVPTDPASLKISELISENIQHNSIISEDQERISYSIDSKSRSDVGSKKSAQSHQANVKVIARFRPLNKIEEAMAQKGLGGTCCQVLGENSVLLEEGSTIVKSFTITN